MATQVATVQTGYVIRDDGEVAVQIADPESRWGFYIAELATDNPDEYPTTYGGGFGWATNRTFELVADDDARLTAFDRDRYQWMLDEERA